MLNFPVVFVFNRIPAVPYVDSVYAGL
jgi:hypothetical protein